MNGTSPEVRREKFGRVLHEALYARNLTQVDLAEAVESTQGAVSAWVNGKAEPAPFVVFGVEHVLDLTPGFLSAALGYLPVEAVAVVPTIEDAVQASVLVDDDLKPILLAVVREVLRKSRQGRQGLRAVDPVRHRRPGAPGTSPPRN